VPSIHQFEEIEAWQEAGVLAGTTYRLTGDGRLAKDFGLRDQLQRLAVSVMANIAEGFGRGRNQELIHFLVIARGSCAEVQSHLYIALDAGLIDQTDFESASEQADKTARKLSAFIGYLKKASKTNQRSNEVTNQRSNEVTK